MTNRVSVVLALCVVSAAAARAQDRLVRPNVVMIISDDQAWTDFGFMGHPEIRTPHLDALADKSVVFEHGYVPSSLCRPSLATMITGLYPHEHGLTGNDPPKGEPRDRMLSRIAAVDTLPRLLAPLGYESLQTGKWWEGDCRCGGFDEGMTHGAPDRGGRHGDDGLEIGRKTMRPIADFLDARGERPFFLWYAPFLPHTPHNPPERLLQRYRKPGKSVHVAKYQAMCEWFDETCGQLLAMLDERGLTEDTLVVFAVDNGWIQRPDRRGYAQRSKRSPYEGGVRTPILLSWPGRLQPTRRDDLASSVDLAPTILRACGVTPPERMTGRDLRDAAHARDAVFGATFSHDVVDLDAPTKGLQTRWSVHDGFKLVVHHGRAKRVELFHLTEDPRERVELAVQLPERTGAMVATLDAWWSPARFDPVLRRVHGFPVYVDPALLDGEHATEGARALGMLANHLERISMLVEGQPLQDLRQVGIWIEHEHTELERMQYHPSARWLARHGYDTRLARTVHIPRARALLSRAQLLKHPAVVLHELAHAYHDQVLGFDDERVLRAFRTARDGKRYEDVLAHTGRRVRHYAMTDHKEYFAEATEAYLYRNDFFPFVRAELAEFDPVCHDLLERIWGPAR